MESIDALSIASLALAGGLWIGHHLGKATAALEYERLDRWRVRWVALNAKREPNRLQSRQDRIDERARRANNAIGALMRQFDSSTKQPTPNGARK